MFVFIEAKSLIEVSSLCSGGLELELLEEVPECCGGTNAIQHRAATLLKNIALSGTLKCSYS